MQLTKFCATRLRSLPRRTTSTSLSQSASTPQTPYKFKSFRRQCTGFSVIEIIIVVAIMTMLTIMAVNSFIGYRKDQAFQKDVETVTELLTQARAQTLASKGGTQYGVHFATSTATLFSGSAYNASSTSNNIFSLTSTDIILNITLAGGGSDVVFNRLSGETVQNGSVVIDVPALSQTKTVTIYKTGLISTN